ncbi:uncharacterized peroxidase-related enzyme [Pseudarcicella hirudinis]|uniref:Uncharacterized peroxidase-related enzyme n=2 Tax=Pseudarcicella hirudinis TaxID=1079859 RepID=A0A1I5MDP8_9BACT|nr:uncharacterized peroxidase-related enzyme [Pseudarcicella hirudinis]
MIRIIHRISISQTSVLVKNQQDLFQINRNKSFCIFLRILCSQFLTFQDKISENQNFTVRVFRANDSFLIIYSKYPMAHIKLLNEELPGITGLLNYRPETAKSLLNLAETLLRSESTLTSGERELIASYVSHLNGCHFCHTSHGAAAAAHLQCDLDLIDDIKQNFATTGISPKLRALLNIAAKVQKGGKNVLPEDITLARNEEATDKEIHDTVLIAAAFCMFNRYVDGLGTFAPKENEAYRQMGEMMAFAGYNRPR